LKPPAKTVLLYLYPDLHDDASSDALDDPPPTPPPQMRDSSKVPPPSGDGDGAGQTKEEGKTLNKVTVMIIHFTAIAML
jgi:hypothetical protein